MNDIDKNDVDISRLFSWGKEVIIKDEQDNSYSIYIRIVGDADLNRARAHALRCSNELRKNLKNKNSNEYMESIPDISDMPNEDLIKLVILSQIPQMTRKIAGEVDLPFPKEPSSDAELEELEKYQQAIDEYPDKRSEKIQNLVRKDSEKREKELEKLSKEELIKEYERYLIYDLCETEMVKKFRIAQIYYATYSDPDYKNRFFESIEQADNLRAFVKNQFLNAYDQLEISMDELKK